MLYATLLQPECRWGARGPDYDVMEKLGPVIAVGEVGIIALDGLGIRDSEGSSPYHGRHWLLSGKRKADEWHDNSSGLPDQDNCLPG